MDPSATTPTPDLAGHRILVVDGAETTRDSLARVLTTLGCEVAVTGTGGHAAALYPEFKPDLVLLAATLPDGDGLAAGRRLRQTHGAACAPILYLLSSGDTPAPGAILAAGGTDGLRQPLQPDELAARLHPHLLVTRLRAQLTEATAAKHRLLGQAAHDLRNPLGTIGNLAQFLRDGTAGPLNADQRELVDTIRATTESMLALVSDLLDVATIEAGELRLVADFHNLTELIEQSVYLAGIAAARKKIRLALAAPGPTPRVLIDATKLKQVIDNLLSNAVKYSPPGSTVTVALHTETGHCHLSVQDQGPGIPAGERNRLFQDFGRLSVRPTGGENSTGLGLAICHKIIEAHGGTITAANLPEGGCQFRVTLPLAR